MNIKEELAHAFESTMVAFNASAPIAKLIAGDFKIAHYQSILREVYHYTKEDPQMQGLAAVYFRGVDRDTVKMFFKHAISEVGHDLLALKDLENMGKDVSHIASSNPLPATIALTAFPFYQIIYRNPIGYLGYLYFLEFMPTQVGHIYQAALERAGVPANALGFLMEHIEADQAHNMLMFEYLKRLIHTQDDLDAVIYTMRVSGHLYSEMLRQAMDNCENPTDYGVDAGEISRMQRQAAA